MKRNRQHSSSQQATKLSDHLSEIRWRVLLCLLAFITGGLVVYSLRSDLFTLLQAPLNSPLYYTAPSGSLSFILRFSTIGALAALIPMVTYHVLMFVRPAIDNHVSRKRVILTALASFILALAGIAFGFFIILPVSLAFFSGFQMDGLESLISADSYLSLVANILTVFALTFQIPLIISFIDHITPLKPSMLLRAEKWVLLASLIVSVLVPFAWDMTTSLLIAAPILVLYNIAIVIVLLQHGHRKSRTRTAKKTTHVLEITKADSTTNTSLKHPSTASKTSEPTKSKEPRSNTIQDVFTKNHHTPHSTVKHEPKPHHVTEVRPAKLVDVVVPAQTRSAPPLVVLPARQNPSSNRMTSR